MEISPHGLTGSPNWDGRMGGVHLVEVVNMVDDDHGIVDVVDDEVSSLMLLTTWETTVSSLMWLTTIRSCVSSWVWLTTTMLLALSIVSCFIFLFLFPVFVSFFLLFFILFY